ncbi:MAG: ACT domain-containing protein [Actinomycetota bacterium]
MLEEIIIRMEDKPGILAEVGELLGSRGVNIETLAASTVLGEGVIHLVVDDGDDAAETLKSNGFIVDRVRPVLTATIDDKPGEFGAYCRRLHDAGVDISAVYVAHKENGETEMIFAVDDLDSAQKA